jgi:hypothetical protein
MAIDATNLEHLYLELTTGGAAVPWEGRDGASPDTT